MKGPCELCGVEFRSSWSKICAACKTDIDTSTLRGAALQIYCWADDDDSGVLAEAAKLLKPFLPELGQVQPGAPYAFTYEYFAGELATFMKLVRNPGVSEDDLAWAYRALGHLYTHVAEPQDALERLNFRKGFEIATSRYVARQAGEPLPPAPGGATDGGHT